MKKSTVPVSEGTAVFWLIAKNDFISTDICHDGIKTLSSRLKTSQNVTFLKEEMDICCMKSRFLSHVGTRAS